MHIAEKRPGAPRRGRRGRGAVVCGAVLTMVAGMAIVVAWTAPAGAGTGSFPGASAIACPSASDCFAVGQGYAYPSYSADIVATTDAGTTWTPQTVPSGVGVLLRIACPSTSDCFAVGPNGSGEV